MNTEIEYVYSHNGEDDWQDELADIYEFDELEPGDIVYRGEKYKPEKMSFMPNHGDIIDHVATQAYDIGDEWAEDYPDLSKEAKDKLDELLKQWAEKYLPDATFWQVHSVKEYEITEGDLA